MNKEKKILQTMIEQNEIFCCFSTPPATMNQEQCQH